MCPRPFLNEGCKHFHVVTRSKNVQRSRWPKSVSSLATKQKMDIVRHELKSAQTGNFGALGPARSSP